MKPIKKSVFFIALFITITFTYCKAQPFQLIKATSQRWAGGVAGRSGVNYSIEIETKSRTEIPDTVWLNGNIYPLIIKDKGGNVLRSYDSATHKIKYVIMLGESNNQFANPPNRLRNNQSTQDTVSQRPKPIRQFDGAAMISYRYRHKQRFFIVKAFTQLQALNYP